MELNKDNYTKAEVEQIIQNFKEQVEELQGRLEEGNKAIERVKELEQANLNNSIKLAMTKAGLDEDLFDLVVADDLEKAQSKIDKLVELKKKQDIDNAYKPKEKRSEDQYSKLEKSGDVEGMIKNKLSRLFG